MPACRFLVLLLMVLSATCVGAGSLRISTEHYPPLNYINSSGQPTGLVYDLVVEVLTDIGQPELIDKITFMPWARAYRETLSTPDSLLFSVIRSPERETDFYWLGPVAVTGSNLIVGDQFSYPSLDSIPDEVLQRMTIGVVRNDFGEQLLEQHPVLSKASRLALDSPSQAARMLSSRRIDAWSYSFDTARIIMQQEGLDSRRFQSIYTFGDYQLIYLAFNRNTNPDIIRQFQRSLERMVAIDPVTRVAALQYLEQRYDVRSLFSVQYRPVIELVPSLD